MKNPNGSVFQNFRTNPYYCNVVPSSSVLIKEAQTYIKELYNFYPYLMKLEVLKKFEAQDDFGNPQKHNFEIGEFTGNLEPYSFKLIFTIGNLIELFGNLDGMSICEIGPGFGQTFKLITDLFPSIKYTFVDLDGPIWICKQHVQYLKRENQIQDFLTCDQIMSDSKTYKFDLIFSDHAFDECNLEVQHNYLDKLINSSQRGKIMCNDEMNHHEQPYMKMNEIFQNITHPDKHIICDKHVLEVCTGDLILWGCKP